MISIQKGNTLSARSQLGAFIKQVQALVKSGLLSAQNAAGLTSAAMNIIASLKQLAANLHIQEEFLADERRVAV